jgi:hypothetical protein
MLQGSATLTDDPADIGRADNGSDIVLLEVWQVPDATINPAPQATITRSIDPDVVTADATPVTVTLNVADFGGSAFDLVETFPASASVTNNGGGTVVDQTITFSITGDGDYTYVLSAAADPCADTSFSAARAPNCGGVLGESQYTVEADTPLKAAFIFGSRNLTCETPNEACRNYTMVHHAGNNCDAHNALAYGYDDGSGPRPWGFEVFSPTNTQRNCAMQFSVTADDNDNNGLYGRFDESPNNRNQFGDDCPDQIYDSFIGAKSHSQPCNVEVVGNDIDPCTPDTLVAWRDNNADTVVDENDAEPYVPNGIVFRADVPNGLYRFVGVFGDADNPHAHHIIAEDGGSGPPADETGWLIGQNNVELVRNFSQRRAGGARQFAAVGFEDKLPPMNWDPSNANDPILHFMDENGLETACNPNSPVLEVTQGYVRIHILQGSRPGTGGDADDGGDIVLLELWQVPSDVIETTPTASVDRSIDPGKYTPGQDVAITLTATGVTDPDPFAIVDTFPEGWTLKDNGGGTVVDNTITFIVNADGDSTYVLEAGTEPNPATFSGTFGPGCVIGGADSIAQEPFECVPGPENPAFELVAAFAFGSRDLTVPLHNDPGVTYTMIHHAANDCATHDSLAYGYDDGSGPLPYGFEITDPGNGGRNCAAQFGPFDDSPNNRNRLADNEFEEVYDSFIGLKNYAEECSDTIAGMEANPGEPCAVVLADRQPDPFPLEGAVFRVDVPDGLYRFVAVVGESDNPHANRLLAENGGSGGVIADSSAPNSVTLVYNHDQAQWDIGQVRGPDVGGNCYGCGVFARVGFNCRVGPTGDGVFPDPVFVNMGPDGQPLPAGPDGEYGTADDLPPQSPALEVTEGYVRFHLLQGNSNDGPGGKGRPGDAPPDWVGGRDANGTDLVLLELWKAGESADPQFIRGDSNGDGSVNIADAIYILQRLFAGGAPIACLETGDSNDDDSVNIADGIYILQRLFAGGAPIPPPNPGCGTDTTLAPGKTDLGCESYPNCP